MKKFIIGIAVLGIYAIYSLGIRHQNPLISKPASLSNAPAKSNNSSNSASSSASTNTSSSSSNSNTPAPSASTGQYKDGTYVGDSVNVYFGNVQVSATISGGKITNVKFLQYPNSHSTSVYINQQAMPYLIQEAIQSQNSNVQVISGATFTSQGFTQSLQSALAKA